MVTTKKNLSLKLMGLLFLCIPVLGKAQLQDSTFFMPSTTLNKQRSNLVLYGGGGGAAISLAALYSLWYSGYDQSWIHTTNDWDNWLQMDKMGHATTAYVVGQTGYDVFKWAGNSEKKSAIVGGSVGWMYQSVVEVMDGFSDEWGFSWGDVAFNTAGAGLFVGQQLLWEEQRIMLKWSYHTTPYANISPNLLGENDSQRWLKDYNGQTYWLSVNPRSFTKEKMKWWPHWLNVAGGYGADKMITANGSVHPQYPNISRQRQYYFSFDIDLRRIKVKSSFLRTVLHTISFVKIPAPTIEFNQNGSTQFYWLYF